MTTQEKIEVMKAYDEGKKIQVFELGTWKDVGMPLWNWGISEYRVKPEAEYRSYKDSNEMVEDFKKRAEIATNEMFLPMIYIKSKNNGCRILLNTFGAVSVDGILFCDLLDEYTYLDGSPCGIKEET